MLNDAPDQCPPTRKRTVSVGKFEGKDSPTELAAPLSKVSHVATDPLKTTSHTTGSSRPWLQTVQTVGYSGSSAHVADFNQLKWHQASTETDPFFVANLDPSFASPNYTPTSCTPLAPISELLPPQQFTSYDLQAVEIPSPPSYITIQTVSSEPSSFAGHSLTALSSVPMLDTGSQPSLETYTIASPASAESLVAVESSSKGLQSQGQLWTPGWSMLRQMLSQSHRENALMHGVVNPPSSSVAEYSQRIDSPPHQPATTASLQFVSTALTDHGFSYVTSPQHVHESDVLYVQMTADTDNTSVFQQPFQVTTDDTEGGTQEQLATAGYGDVQTTAVSKTLEADNNNESIVEEKNI